MLPADWRQRFKGRIRAQQPLAPLTSWRIGGPAQLYLEPATVEELVDTVHVLRRVGLPYRVLGGGSNLLVSDRGVPGAMVSLARLDRIEPAGPERVWAEGGAKLHWLVRYAAACGLSGAECLAGIPGRVGGAIFGNAGGKYGDIGRLVRCLQVIDEDGGLETLEPSADFFSYRGSRVGNRVVVRALLELSAAEPAAVRAFSRRVIKERRETQPGWIGNAGCVFRNPAGASAGKLIEEAGCKGLRFGGVYVSPRHANFMENGGGGTESDVRRLIAAVRERVHHVHGVDLEMEVRRWT